MPFELGLPELIVVLVIALVFLGPQRLPEAGRALGRSITEFREGISGTTTDEPAQHVDRPGGYTPPPPYTPPPAE
jgi:sec-independent protein translocase protein TatA